MKRIALFLFIITTLTGTMAQTSHYDWPRVEQLLRKGSSSTALSLCNTLAAEAAAEQNPRQMLYAAIYTTRAESTFVEDYTDSALARLQRLEPYMRGEDKALWLMTMGLFYGEYLSDNGWSLSRNLETNEPLLDYKLWSRERMRATASDYLYRAVEEGDYLAHAAVGDYPELLEECNTEATETLMDVVLDRLMGQYQKGLPALQTLAEPTPLFTNAAPMADDEEAARLIGLLQRQAHEATKGTAERQLRTDLQRQQWVHGLVGDAVDWEKAYQHSWEHYRGLPQCHEAATYCLWMAEIWHSRGEQTKALEWCEQGLRLTDKGHGAKGCSLMKEEILRHELSVKTEQYLLPDEPTLAEVGTRNVDRVWVKIVENVDLDNIYNDEDRRRRLLKQRVLKEWEQPVANLGDHQERNTMLYLPAMPYGRYWLLVGESREMAQGSMAYSRLESRRLAFVTDWGNQLDSKEPYLTSGLLVDRKSGRGVAGQTVTLTTRQNGRRSTQRCTTDPEGRYRFVTGGGEAMLSTTYKGATEEERIPYYYGRYRNERRHSGAELMTDKPVYRLGEKVAFGCVAYRMDSTGHDARVLAGVELEATLKDPNYREVGRMTLRTDIFGRCHGTMELPQNGLNGHYTLEVADGDHDLTGTTAIRVEAYRQPKFMVTLPPDNEEHLLGESVTVRGMAASYSQMPVSGARVGYTVRRTVRLPWWRRWFEPYYGGETVVAQGSGTTDEEGAFELAFTPTPDPTMDAKKEPYYVFQVEVEVTDINGESHSATRSMAIGEKNRYVAIESDDSDEWNELRFQYCNLDNQPMQGEVHVKIERLRLPERALLDVPAMSNNTYQSMPPEQYRRDYPLMAYSADYNDREKWEVERVAYETNYTADGTGRCSIALPEMASGTYRISIDDGKETYTRHLTLTRPKERRCQSAGLLWHECPQTAEVGETATLRLGSRMKEVTVHYQVQAKGKTLMQGSARLDNGIETIEIPVSKEMLGGFTVSLMAMKQGVATSWSGRVEVPYSEKQLEVEVSTFRDRLTPGEEETWTLRVKKGGSPVTEAALMATLYDDALTTYGALHWALWPWKNNPLEPALQWEEPLRWSNSLNDNTEGEIAIEEEAAGCRLKGLITPWYGYASRRTNMLYAMAAPRMAKGATMPTTEECDFAYEEAVVLDAEPETPNSQEPVAIRTDLSTSGFFMPTLVSDTDSGCVEIEFKVPELLTRWNFQALAWTRELAIGDVKRQMVTQKELMVVPNVPRFMRHGDKASIAAKVSNLGEKQQQVEVSLEMSDSQTGKPFMVETQRLSVEPKQNGYVVFDIEVPENVFVATYRIVARGEGASDGEQAQIALLPNRQLVTESMSMYLNGPGEKGYTMEHLMQTDSPTLRQHRLKVEWCSSPMWYAIQSMPYLKQQQSPSHTYLMNQLFVNSLSLDLLEKNPQIEQMLKRWGEEEPEAFLSQLEKNQEIRQTLLEETPWLQEAKEESAQHRQTGEFFKREQIEPLQRETEQKLLDGQMGNGAWSWIAGGQQASLWVTESMAQTLGDLRHRGIRLSREMERSAIKALKYADAEENRLYKKYVKGKALDATDIYYLYMRSYYEGTPFNGSREAYDFYYQNLLKHHGDYHSLHTKAQLALIFYRHGDKAVAQKIADNIKETALYSDEMGMYWRDNNGGYSWYQRPVETQALLIEMMQEVTGDEASVGKMQQWLLKQRQTTHWNSDMATAKAIAALLTHNGRQSLEGSPMEVAVGGVAVVAKAESGTGYSSRTWEAEEIVADMGTVTLKKEGKGPAWGAMYWQYFEDLDKIPYNEMGIRLQKSLYKMEHDGTMSPLTTAKVGDRIRVRILIDCDRNLEYLELKDQRAGGLEPVSTQSGWHWNGGLCYYADIHDASSSFFIERLEKGKYVLEYELWANNAGEYSCGVATIQCMYAPEFRSNTHGTRLVIERQ